MRALALAVVALAASTPSTWASPAEMRWLTRVGEFEQFLGGVVERHDYATLATCRARFGAAVGRPPTTRLEASFHLLSDGCRDLGRWAAGRGADAALFARARNEIRRSAFEATVGQDRTLPFLRGKTPASHRDPLLERAARLVAGKRVVIRCWSSADWRSLLAETAALGQTSSGGHETIGGLTTPGGDAVNLAPETCAGLAQVETGSIVSEFRAALGLKGLAHEAEHTRGIADERTADCYALQEVEPVARALGRSARSARALARAALLLYRSPEEPAREFSPQCRNGGPLDLRPRSSAWP